MSIGRFSYLKKCKSSSALGLDGIRYDVLKPDKDDKFIKWWNGFRNKRIAIEHVFRLVEETSWDSLRNGKVHCPIFIDV